MSTKHKISLRKPAAFSLVELLVVITIMLLLINFTSLGLNQVLKGMRIEQAGRLIMDEINLARQIAVARNLNVELRLIHKDRAGGTNGVFYCLQSGVRSKSGDGAFTPVSRLAQLPDGMAMATNATLSSLIGSQVKSTSTNPAYSYVAVIIRPTGNLEPAAGLPLNQPWFVTAVPENKLGAGVTAIDNFVTVQIDPWTARPTAYRP